MGLIPESEFAVWVEDSQIVCRSPNGLEAGIGLEELRAVRFEAGAGPWETDWWVLSGRAGEELAFPLGAEGEAIVLERLKRLPGFAAQGMNATDR